MYAEATGMLYSVASYRDSQATMLLYTKALARGRRGQLWSGLTGRTRGLLSLGEVAQACTGQARCSGGTRTVAIAQICGSENRAADFDHDFNPLQDHTRDRWLGIAAARLQGRSLPPVALIQVGEQFFVRDGHHRISVALALGQKDIEATVEVWQSGELLPVGQRPQASVRSHVRDRGGAPTLAHGSRRASFVGWLTHVLQPAERAGAS